MILGFKEDLRLWKMLPYGELTYHSWNYLPVAWPSLEWQGNLSALVPVFHRATLRCLQQGPPFFVGIWIPCSWLLQWVGVGPLEVWDSWSSSLPAPFLPCTAHNRQCYCLCWSVSGHLALCCIGLLFAWRIVAAWKRYIKGNQLVCFVCILHVLLIESSRWVNSKQPLPNLQEWNMIWCGGVNLNVGQYVHISNPRNKTAAKIKGVKVPPYHLDMYTSLCTWFGLDVLMTSTISAKSGFWLLLTTAGLPVLLDSTSTRSPTTMGKTSSSR